MKQNLYGGTFYGLNHTWGVQYNSVNGAAARWGPAFENIEYLPTPGTISRLKIKLSPAVAADSSITFTVMKNGNPTSLECVIGDGETDGQDLDPAHAVSVVAGDYVNLRYTPTGTPGENQKSAWCTLWEGTDPSESICMGVSYCNKSQTVWDTCPPVASTTVSENYARVKCLTTGKFTKMRVVLATDPGVAPDGYKLTLRDDGVDTDLTVTITSPSLEGNDEHDVVIASGHYLSISIIPLNGPANHSIAYVSLVFEPDINGESLVAGKAHFSGGITYFHTLNFNQFGQNEDQQEVDIRNMASDASIIKKVYAKVLAAPGEGKSHNFRISNGGVQDGADITIADLDTEGSDIVSVANIPEGGTLGTWTQPTNTPADTTGYWIGVSYIAPPPPGLENKSANMGAKMMARGLI